MRYGALTKIGGSGFHYFLPFRVW